MFGKPKHVEIIKHHRNASIYLDGRYLHVDAKLSVKSKRQRQVAIETAMAILDAVGFDAQDAMRDLSTQSTASNI